MWFVALLPEIFDALAAGGSALLGWLGTSGWWQLPVFVTLFRVSTAAGEAAVTPPPPPGTPQSPVQAIVGGAGQAGSAAAGAATSTAQAVGSLSQFVRDNAVPLAIGGVALFVFTRR